MIGGMDVSAMEPMPVGESEFALEDIIATLLAGSNAPAKRLRPILHDTAWVRRQGSPNGIWKTAQRFGQHQASHFNAMRLRSPFAPIPRTIVAQTAAPPAAERAMKTASG